MRSLFTLLVLLYANLLFAQSNDDLASDKLIRARIEVERKLKNHLGQFSYTPNLSFKNYDFLNSDGRLQLSDGTFSEVQYIDETGFPVVYTTFNAKAAITTGAAQLNPGGRLGLNLTGKGMTVGIIDQTRPKPDHIEFGNRMTQKDGSTEVISTHATHVTGTVLAAGINPAAKGMAYEATGWAFNWENDISKMLSNSYDPVSKPDGMILSNHSYGIVLGWTQNSSGWVWSGNSNVDENEDYRFGFYSSKSQAIDELLYSRPYYSVIWAAGNDRSDKGDGTKDADGPEDTIGPEGVAKNNITIGAVESVLDYTVASDVKMSSFSSWGPPDDGRIKPDLVAMGVGVFSSSVNNGTDSYQSLNGTSMAAPNASGSLFLLQQLYSQRNVGKYMLSSTLKALAIQTSREAGPSIGPDYMYGWGLLNVEDAATLILGEDGASNRIQEDILENGKTVEFDFLSDGVTPIKVTLVWTDPAGNPVAPSLDPTDLMLTNDLDLRVIDEDGKSYFPWSLDPSNGVAAKATQTKDNFRDNVEQVLISSPAAKKYRVVVSHKGDLEFGVQQYSLVFKAGVLDGAAETLYWIGGASGSWNTGANWSLSSNGPTANKVPGSSTRVVFDGTSDQKTSVTLPSNASAFSLNLFGSQPVEFDFNSKQLQLSNGLRVSNKSTTFRSGSIILTNSGDNEQIVEVGNADFEEFTLNFSSGNWEIIDADALANVVVGDASLSIALEKLQVESFSVSNSGEVDGIVNEISFTNELSIAAVTSLKENVGVVFEGTTGTFSNSGPVDFNKLTISSGKLSISSRGYNNLTVSEGEALLGIESLTVSELTLGPSSVLNLGSGGELIVSESIVSNATATGKALITAGTKGKIVHDIYLKYCFNNLNISNVDLEGDAVISLGTNATVSNSSGWLEQLCDQVLFANFVASYTCVGAAVTFENLSEGAISSYLWDFSGMGTSDLEDPFFVFSTPGKYKVNLRVSNEQGFTDYEQEIEIVDNGLQQPVIVANGNVLTSQQPGTSYQWYQNGQTITGANQRSYEATGDGLYQVAIFNDACNRISEPVVISAIPDQEVELSRFGIFVGPNPTDLLLNVRISNEYTGPVTFRVISMEGKVNMQQKAYKNERDLNAQLELTGNAGVYILQIETNNLTFHKKVIKH
ncbi:S8 family serine peptidase [uncultured Algoriphagus sp.]|uniref:S8 family serine peptidase n=1 Tax=uncultured Algoriphagus sp. TaxID=417365 RepID=UPI0030EBC300|tara:strand:+ start:18475 stop:21921 length:3447 start_codon:yes stop_codon:yes gene_type:complete